MSKVKVPDVVKDWFRSQGVNKLDDFLQFDNKIIPVFLMNPEGSEGYVTDPNIPGNTVYELKDDAYLEQANPVSGTKYTVLDTATNVRIYSISCRCTWTVQPNPIEVHGTIDGLTLLWDIANPTSDTYFHARFQGSLAWNNMNLHTTDYSSNKSHLLDGRSVKIEAEITGGTVSELRCRVKYGQKS